MRLLALTALVAAAGAVTATAPAAPKTGFAFGRLGGNIMPFTVTISTTGSVTATGSAAPSRRTLSKLQLVNLNRAVVASGFSTLPAVTSCPGTLPDVAAQFIRVGRRTVRVHGSCLPRFNRLWTVLAKSVGQS
jgi:hypothetical protein